MFSGGATEGLRRVPLPTSLRGRLSLSSRSVEKLLKEGLSNEILKFEEK